VRYGRMPEYKKPFCVRNSKRSVKYLSASSDLKVVKLADGAERIGAFSTILIWFAHGRSAQVEQVSITDFYHGADHLQQACDVIWAQGASTVRPSLPGCGPC